MHNMNEAAAGIMPTKKTYFRNKFNTSTVSCNSISQFTNDCLRYATAHEKSIFLSYATLIAINDDSGRINQFS